jgi:hypothetical protein
VAAIPVAENVDYVRIVEEVGDKVLDLLNESREAVVENTTEKVVAAIPYPEKIDYERLADMVAEKLAGKMQQSYDVILDEAGIDAIAEKVAAKLGSVAVAPVVVEEAPVEEAVVEEPIVEGPVVEAPATEELAVAVAPAPELPIFEGDEMVDAETGLVIRLKKSFTAKMKQSEDDVKGYYSEIKNELTSYKRINSNVSWHGDRFNFGRDTVAKLTIVGKTLNLYLALDPSDPEFKTTVYHQKDVGSQKAYESTPFMVKVKSDAAAKKALRLVAALAEKLATEKDEAFVAVDYKDEYCYETTKALFEAGFIKATKEKKVDLDTI